MLKEERREFQRLDLVNPLPAQLGNSPVRIVDLGVLGAGVEGDALPETDVSTLRLTYRDARIVIDCAIVYRNESASPKVAGIRFVEALGESDELLRRLLGDLVTEAIQRIPTAAPGEPISFDPEQTAMRIPAPFASYRLSDLSWTKRGAFIPSQPESGFTLPVDVPFEEVERLRREYENATEHGRRLIRLFAELRVCKNLGVPYRKE